MYLPPGALNFEELLQGDVLSSSPLFEHDKPGLTMILSQSCDAQRRENIVLAPIFSFTELSNKGIKTDTLSSIKLRKTNYWFYLPALEGVVEDSVVDLQQIRSFPRETIESLKRTKIISLSDWGRHHLAWAIVNFFGRPTQDRIYAQ